MLQEIKSLLRVQGRQIILLEEFLEHKKSTPELQFIEKDQEYLSQEPIPITVGEPWEHMLQG